MIFASGSFKKNHETKKINFLPVIICITCIIGCTKAVQDKNLTDQDFSVDKAFRTTKPNIILIVGDDVGFEIPTYNGGSSYSTPNLDFMAANGISFSNYYTNPDGPPARLSLLTGKYNIRNWQRFLYIAPEDKTFANLLQNKGYETCFVGKWQLDGGHQSITGHGFNKYLAFMPFNKEGNNGHDQYWHRYKNPYLYENQNWLPDNQVKGKYSEDMMYNYAANFIDSNKEKPFLLMYSHTLCQRPWSPPPTHTDYATWNPDVDEVNGGDKKYFPAMVNYMDQIIGQLINKVNSTVLNAPTLIIFISDNGSNPAIQSVYNGTTVNGAKGSTTKNGINVPFVAYCKNFIKPGLPDTSLTDVTDFMPTLAQLSNAKIPVSWGQMDGYTFMDNLNRKPLIERPWVYCYWPISTYSTAKDVSYIFNKEYKKYDSISGNYFLDIRNNKEESPEAALQDSLLTPHEVSIKNYFDSILQSFVKLRTGNK